MIKVFALFGGRPSLFQQDNTKRHGGGGESDLLKISDPLLNEANKDLNC